MPLTLAMKIKWKHFKWSFAIDWPFQMIRNCSELHPLTRKTLQNCVAKHNFNAVTIFLCLFGALIYSIIYAVQIVELHNICDLFWYSNNVHLYVLWHALKFSIVMQIVRFLSIFHSKDKISFQSQMIFYLLHIRQMCHKVRPTIRTKKSATKSLACVSPTI